MASGERLRVAEHLEAVARNRMDAPAEQVKAGLLPAITVVDNRRLVVSREIAVVQARRRFEGAALALSLFLRGGDDESVVAGREPLQRREGKGRLEEVEGQIAQLDKERRFARDRIVTEARDAFSALRAAYDQTRHTALNVELAHELEAGEEERFRRGASDLLALQLREQAAFDAEALAIDAASEYLRALADYRAAIAADLPEAAVRAADAAPRD